MQAEATSGWGPGPGEQESGLEGIRAIPEGNDRLERGEASVEPRLRARLLRQLLESPQVTPRRLRAIEHLFLSVLTRPGRAGSARELLEPEAVSFHLANLLPETRASSTKAPAKRYYRLCEEALATRSFAELERRQLLARARSLKYELGARYLEPETIRAAMQCLVLLEQLVDDAGFVGGAQALAPWRRGRVPVESRSASIAGFDAEQELTDGDTSSLEESDMMVVEGRDAERLLMVEAERRRPAPVRTRPAPRPAPVAIRPEPGKAGSGGLITLFLSLFILINLACIAFAGGQWLTAPISRLVDEPASYQAYTLAGTAAQLPFARASRLHEVLLLTADARWTAMERLARQDLMVHLIKNLIGRDGIEEILVVDSAGQRLALASRSELDISRPEGQP